MTATPQNAPSDLALAVTAAGAGLAGMIIGGLTTARPYDIAPALDGTLMMLQLGFVLALFHGIGYRRALRVMTPMLTVLVAAALWQRESPWALVGATLVLYGLIGIGGSVLTRVRLPTQKPAAR